MTRLTVFDSPLLLGFDRFERILDRISKASTDGYPPYNIEQFDENRLRITFAVAGFTVGELEVTVEDNQLVVRGKQRDDAKATFLHRGIATRQFHRTFVLAQGIDVTDAMLDNGLLHIDLETPEPETKVRTIEIRAANPR